MATRTIYLTAFRASSAMRKHFAIWVPAAEGSKSGTMIHVVGAPMVGYKLEFKRNYDPSLSEQLVTLVPLGQVSTTHIVDPESATFSVDSTPKGNLETAANQVPPPPISQNFMAPVDGINNKRCQEWTVEYVNKLISKGYIPAAAAQVLQEHRDPPTHGVGLKPAGRGRGQGA